jgi:addiction module HigA family antidote
VAKTSDPSEKNPRGKSPKHAGVRFQEVLDEHHMSQAELCLRIGRPRKSINEIIKGKASLTPETAFQLELALGEPASYWNQLDTAYQDHLVRQAHAAELAGHLDWLDELPVDGLIRAKWIEKQPTRHEQAHHLLSWFGVATPHCWRTFYREPQADYNSSPRIDCDPGALAAWMRAGEKQADEMKTGKYSRKKFQQTLSEIRGITNLLPQVYQERMIRLCIQSGVALAWARELPGTEGVAGVSRWLSPTKALIELSLAYKNDAQLWFTFFHLAGHILLHGRKQVFVDGLFDGKPSRDDVLEEIEADQFAANFLIHGREIERLKEAAESGELTEKILRMFAREQGLATSIVVGRLRQLGWVPPAAFHDLVLPIDFDPPGSYVDV